MNETQRLRITDLILPITDHASPITHYNRNIKYAFKIDIGTVENLLPLAICLSPEDKMNTIQRIAKNTAALFAAQFVVSLLSLALSIFIARSLGDVIFGKYSFAIAFTALFAVFSDLGYNTLLIREVARDKSQASKYLNNVLCMRALLSLVIFALIVITINLMSYPADTKNAVYLFGIYTLIVSYSAVFKVTFRAFEKMNLKDFLLAQVFFYKKKKCFMNDNPVLIDVRRIYKGRCPKEWVLL